MRPCDSQFIVRSTSSTAGSRPRSTRNRPTMHPKYAQIKSSVDSGLNMLKVNEKFPESKMNARFKKEESFRRMKSSTLVRLLTDTEEEVECLILDVRDRDAFTICHLKNAISFPAPLLKRSVNIFPLEIRDFINKEPTKIIVFYDDNEISAQNTGNLFVEKGVSNIFMLSGGMKEMGVNYPEFIEGQFMIESPYISRTGTPSVKSECSGWSCRSSPMVSVRRH